MKKKLLTLSLLLISHFLVAQKPDSLQVQQLSEVVVSSTRANAKMGLAFNQVNEKELKKQNLGQDLPFLLNHLPSVVVTSDAGTGIGYTGIRIRGTDPTRINVTLNGIPYNDSESQGVYWVNMPDFASSVQSIQMQRGVGSSTNGAGAFGGSINVNTLQLHTEPFAEINATGGSFGTLKTNLLLSSGFLQNRFVFDARISKISSDGFVDRAAANLQSYYVSGGYYHKNSFVRLNIFGGKENTYQSWYGIPQALAKADAAGIQNFATRNYYDEAFKNQMLARGRRFNFYTYENEVDDYAQTHVQLISSWALSKKWRFSPTLHYTKGMGFYEQFKTDQKLVNYGLANIIGGSSEIKSTDLIRRKWLDNDFYGAVWALDYEGQTKLKATIGGGVNQYIGKHFGEIIWAKWASDGSIRHKYYDNSATKNDGNLYGKLFYKASSLFDAYLDLQVRGVGFEMMGSGDGTGRLDYHKKYAFFNPKLGLTFQASPLAIAYLSYAKGSKEPSRQDFVDNPEHLPKAEHLHDFELGYKYKNEAWLAEINSYYMYYRHQLVLTGQVNLTGDAIRQNVDRSHRSGVEVQIAKKISPKFHLSANATLSQNKIKTFEEVVPSYGDSPNEVNVLKDTHISFSPSQVAAAGLNFSPYKYLEISWLAKFVGKQFLDNTSSEDRQLDPFFVNDLKIMYHPNVKHLKALEVSLAINNVFNHVYESNGYTYSYLVDTKITENFVFPQAGINFLSALRLRF
jgi:iron complex outermembrane recepter protein